MKKVDATDTPVKKNDVLEITIDAMGYNGEGIAHVGSFAVFIRGAITGERVRALIIAVKRTFAVGKLQTVVCPSPDRAVPFCSVFGKCGGCDLQHMTYESQLRFKRESVQETFFKAGGLHVEPDEVVPSPQIKNYRNKMSLPVRGDTPQFGFFAAGSHRVVPISECPIQFARNNELIRAFADFLHDNKITGYNETTHQGAVRHLSARVIDGYYTVTVVVNGKQYENPIRAFSDRLYELYGKKFSYYINFNTHEGNRILGEESVLAGGNPQPVQADGLQVCVHPHSFFQVNDSVRSLLYEEVVREAGGGEIVDAYSGAGVLSAMLATCARAVTAIEIEPKAVQSAKDLLARNGIQNVRLVCGDCAKILPQLLQEKKDFTLILDPPRSGCAKSVLQAVMSACPKKIIYVSCNPATLAADVSVLLSRGDYSLIRLTPFDMFPQTANVETLVVLSKKIPDSHINIDVEFGESEGQFSLKKIKERAEARKPKEKVTYKMIQEYIEQTYSFKVHTAYIAEVKRDLGLPMYDAPNAVEELKHPRPHPTPKMVEAIKETLKHFEII